MEKIPFFKLSTGLIWILTLLHIASVAAVLPIGVDGQPLPSLAPMLEKTTPAIVNIATLGHVQVAHNPLLSDPVFRYFFNLPKQYKKKIQSLGSGVIVDARKGYILTNHHVIDKSQQIRITLRDGREFDAEIVGADKETDIAVIQITAPHLTELVLADSDQLRVGDFVVAIGNPFGLGQTVTSGIVSALGRSGLGIEGYEDFIQTDASINVGNSGGALVDLNGELIGINTAILAPGGGSVGIGFAIPTNMARKVMRHLIKYGHVQRGQLGIQIQDLTPELALASNIEGNAGVIVTRVIAGSPAAKAGLQIGDVIVDVNTKSVKNSNTLRNAIGMQIVGEKLKLKIVRDGRTKTIQAIIAKPPEIIVPGKKLHASLAGANFGQIRSSHPLFGQVEGIQIFSVDPQSTAYQGGLRTADIVISANRKYIRTIKDLAQSLRRRRNFTLRIQRGNQIFLFIAQ